MTSQKYIQVRDNKTSFILFWLLYGILELYLEFFFSLCFIRTNYTHMHFFRSYSEAIIQSEEWHDNQVNNVPFVSRKSKMDGSIVSPHLYTAAHNLIVCTWKHKTTYLQIHVAQYCLPGFLITQRTEKTEVADKWCNAWAFTQRY